MAIAISLAFGQEVNQKYSFGDFMNQSFKGSPAEEFNNTVIVGSCFHQEASEDAITLREIEKDIFPAGMHGVTFRRCNLDNVFIPLGNIIWDEGWEKCTHKKIKLQNDWRYWILGEDLKPIEPKDKEEWIKRGISIRPEDIPTKKFTKEEKKQFEELLNEEIISIP